jgi:hypothetical protein
MYIPPDPIFNYLAMGGLALYGAGVYYLEGVSWLMHSQAYSLELVSSYWL